MVCMIQYIVHSAFQVTDYIWVYYYDQDWITAADTYLTSIHHKVWSQLKVRMADAGAYQQAFSKFLKWCSCQSTIWVLVSPHVCLTVLTTCVSFHTPPSVCPQPICSLKHCHHVPERPAVLKPRQAWEGTHLRNEWRWQAPGGMELLFFLEECL